MTTPEASPSSSPATPDFFPDHRPDNGAYDTGASLATVNWKRDREASRMVAMGYGVEDVADTLGYKTPGAAAAGIRRAFAAHVRFTNDELRWSEVQSLGEVEAGLWKLLDEDHVLVQQGRVIVIDGVPASDKRMYLEIYDRIMKVKERRAKLLGLDATTRISVEADQIGGEIAQLIAMINGTDVQPNTIVVRAEPQATPPDSPSAAPREISR